MPVTTEIKSELNLTIFKATGVVPFNEQLEIIKSFYSGSPTKNVIWDFTQAQKVDISSEELHEIIEYTKSHSAGRASGRTALVVNTKLKFGLARMASIFSEIEKTPWQMEAFENLEEAMIWISEIE